MRLHHFRPYLIAIPLALTIAGIASCGQSPPPAASPTSTSDPWEFSLSKGAVNGRVIVWNDPEGGCQYLIAKDYTNTLAITPRLEPLTNGMCKRAR